MNGVSGFGVLAGPALPCTPRPVVGRLKLLKNLNLDETGECFRIQGVSATIRSLMKPRLLSATSEFVLRPTGDTIGRDPGNSIYTADPQVSSWHCRIESEGDRFVLVDCDSRNGTRLNGIDIDRASLSHGDEIRVGMTLLRFLWGAENQPCAVSIEEDSSEFRETVRLDAGTPLFFEPRGSESDSEDRLNRDMRALLLLNSGINAIDDADALQRKLLESIFDVTPAETGVILFANATGDDFLPSTAPITRHRVPGAVRMSISRSISHQVLISGEPVLKNGLVGNSSASASVAANRIDSVLCVPLSVRGYRTGIVYIDKTDRESAFDSRHLELVTAMASIGAIALEHLNYVESMEVENQHLAEVSIRHDMVGSSSKMAEVYKRIACLAPTRFSVLVLGETGTGKELVARAVHRNSTRSNGPFIAVNCARFSSAMMESELFGSVKGAYTGADRDRPGLIEAAKGGTLFLDEIGDLPAECQSKLLRAIENREVLRVGDTKPKVIDVRFVFATNQNLDDSVKAARFRPDLRERLGVVITVPPLRERLEDIPSLVDFFLEHSRKETSRELKPTPPETIRVLREFSWPGNVRQLQRVIHEAVAFGSSDRIRPRDLPENIRASGSSVEANEGGRLDDVKDSFERGVILNTVREVSGNVSQAAALLGRSRPYLERRITKLGLREQVSEIRTGPRAMRG